MNTPKTTGRELWQYGFLALPVAFAGFPLYVLVPDFYATQYKLPLGLLGFILLALRAGDAFLEPWLGYASDRLRRAASLLLPCAGILLCASVYALFNQVIKIPILSLVVFMSSAVIAYSYLSISLAAFGALWTKVPEVQTRIASCREAFGLIGLVFAVSAPNFLARFFNQDQVYLVFSLSLGILMIAALWLFVVWLRDHRNQLAKKEPRSRRIGVVFRTMSPSLRQFLVAYGVSMLASSIPAILVAFFVRDLLGAEPYTGIFLLVYFLAAAAGMPLWKTVSIKYGKYRAWLLATGLAVLSFVWAFFLGQHDIFAYGLVCVFSGVALGADLVLPPSILADTIHRHALQDDVATHFALLSLLAKLGLAVASAVALPLLDMSGFVPAGENSQSALLVLSIAYALIPCLIKLAAALLIYRLILHANHEASYEKFGTIVSHVGGNNHA